VGSVQGFIRVKQIVEQFHAGFFFTVYGAAQPQSTHFFTHEVLYIEFAKTVQALDQVFQNHVGSFHRLSF
jgi:hypothetical protein